jgi:hypothetical protein
MIMDGAAKWKTIAVGKLGNKCFSQLNPLRLV